VKQVFRSLYAASILLLVCGLFTFAQAQTPDQSVAQITSSAGNSFANDISGDGRFVVIESTGNIATNSTNKNNADGNREIFLFDNTQNSIFQITNTTSALNDKTVAATTASNIKLEIDNIRPVISRDGRFIVFSSNAPTPASFNANSLDTATLNGLTTSDGFNTELFIYQIPTATDKSGGTLTRLTTTQTSRTPQSATTTRAAFIADDNRDAAVSDDGSLIAFASTVRVASDTPSGSANTDGSSEIFIYSAKTGTFTQLTNTTGDFVFNDNPSLSADGSTVAFISNAIIAGGDNNDDGRGNGNAEIFLANVNSNTGAVTTAPRQITRTKASATVSIANILSPGRRLSRDGNFLAFESSATSPTANDGANQVGSAIFVYNVAANSFSQFGPRAANANNEVIRFPTFSDYKTPDNSDCTDANRATCTRPTTLVFASRLSFTASGDAPPSPTDASSLNPNSNTQIFRVSLSQPNAATNPANRFTRLTNTPAPAVATIPLTQPLPSDSSLRLAFSLGATDLVTGGNADNSTEVFYLTSRTSTTTGSSATVSFTTALGLLPVTPGAAAPAVAGLAPGEIGIINLSPAMSLLPQSNESAPALQMKGVSVSVNNAAALIYSVSANQITFVVPPELSATAANAPANVVISNSNDNTVTRAALPIIAAQPDIGIVENNNNRAVVFNVTGGMMSMSEPFSATTPVITPSGMQSQQTVLGIMLTGVRNIQPSQVTVTIGTTDITGAAIQAVAQTTTPGFDQIDVQIPASLAGLKDQPVIVSVTIGDMTYTSRANAAPLISLQ
jgi:uncharacterized protein (TIGR03437 family)